MKNATAIALLSVVPLLALPATAVAKHRHHHHRYHHHRVYADPYPEFIGYSRYDCGFVRAPGHPVFSGRTYIGNTRARRAEALTFGADPAAVCPPGR